MLFLPSAALVSIETGNDAPSVEGPSIENEYALILRAQSGDVQAFEQIYRCHAARVHGLCLRLLKDVSLAEDCVQETFINAWRHLKRFEARASLATWLHRIAVNAALTRSAPKFTVELDENIEGIDNADNRDLGQRLDIEQALMQLPSGARHVLVLMGIYGHTHVEAAEMLGIAVGTCKAQLHRARKLMAQHLNQEWPI
jgi:RNA polymerase sigma-70 factor (ECF subfamily)